MDSKELRIGNYVKYEGYECYREINEISKHCIKYHDPILMPYCEAPEKPVLVGIPLTEEWLIKFGFEKKEEKRYSIVHYRQTLDMASSIREDENDFLPLYQDDLGCGFNTLRWVSYVHQLQNLYYALTKQELTIKK